MPGLLVLLSIAAVAVMAMTGATSKTPSPSAPPPSPPPPGGSGSTLTPLMAVVHRALKDRKVGDPPVAFIYEGGRYSARVVQDGSATAARVSPIMKKGDPWLITIEVAVSPGTTFDKTTFEAALKSAMSTNLQVKSFNWIGNTLTAQTAVIPKIDLDDVILFKPTQIATASVVLTNALYVPMVV